MLFKMESRFYDYANAAWKKDVKTTAKNLTKIYQEGVRSPFRTNIILHDIPSKTLTDVGILKILLKIPAFLKTLGKAENLPEVQPAKEKFIETIKQTYPHTAPLRQMLIDCNRFSIDGVLPKASEEVKVAIKNRLNSLYTQEELEALKRMWQNMGK